MGASQRRKGIRAEQEVAKLYRDAGFDCARVPNSGGLKQKGDLTGIPGVHCEVKIGKNIRFWDAIEQCEGEAGPLDIPVVHFRRDGDTEWRAILPLDELQALLKLREL